MGLFHISNEADSGRVIQVSKKKSEPNIKPLEEENSVPKATMQSKAPLNSNNQGGKPEKIVQTLTTEVPGSVLTKDLNTSSNDAQGSTISGKHEECSTKNIGGQENSKAKINLKKKKQKKKDVLIPEPAPEDDLDALLAETVRLDNTCSHPKCEVSLKLMSLTCIHCLKRWCFKHSLPEIHGCGEAAKSHARSQIGKMGPPKVDPIKRTHIKRSLDKNLAKMAQQRKHKTEQPKN